MQSIEVACVGCHYIEDNIINWKIDLDIQSLQIKRSPVEADPYALGVFIEGQRVGFVPVADKDTVLAFAENILRKDNKKVTITYVKSSIDDPGIVLWFKFRIDIG